MKLRNIYISILLLFPMLLFAEDYQYQYFNSEKDKYVPFSDYIPKVRQHYRAVPHYLEDFYELYGMKQYYNENSLRKNIERLKIALTCNFRHPSQAIVKVNSEQEYLKYRRLMFMHINILILRNYLRIGSRYDMQNLNFYHTEFADEILDSFNTAEKLYKEAKPYWEKARKYAFDASDIKITTDLGKFESERYSIITGDPYYNFGKIIDDHLKRLNDKRRRLKL